MIKLIPIQYMPQFHHGLWRYKNLQTAITYILMRLKKNRWESIAIEMVCALKMKSDLLGGTEK